MQQPGALEVAFDHRHALTQCVCALVYRSLCPFLRPPQPLIPHLSSLVLHQEEVLARPDIQTPHLRPTTISLPARHRAMRAASLICGRPETIDLTKHNPSLLHNLVASADACTQPHVGWETYWNENDESLADILQARNVTSMPAGNQRFCSTVDPEGWPSRDQEGITKLRHKLSQYTANGGSTEHLSGYEVVAMHELEQNLEKNLDGVGRVFEAACKRKQVVVMFQDWSE